MTPYNPLYLDPTKKVSSEEIEQFSKENIQLNEEIAKAGADSSNNREVITDGIFDYEGYLRSKFKILWLLKEPYDNNGGGWHISKLYDKEFGPDRTTWYPIINATHSIFNNFKVLESGETMKQSNTSIKNVLLHIAYMNVQKLPSKTREKSHNSVIHEAFKNETNKKFFVRQFELLNPDIIIGGNTLWMMFEHFGLKGTNLKFKPTEDSYIVGDKLFIDAYHPANRKDRTAYIQHIVSAAKVWHDARSTKL